MSFTLDVPPNRSIREKLEWELRDLRNFMLYLEYGIPFPQSSEPSRESSNRSNNDNFNEDNPYQIPSYERIASMGVFELAMYAARYFLPKASSSPANEKAKQDLYLQIWCRDELENLVDLTTPARIFLGITYCNSNPGHRYAQTRYVWSETLEHNFHNDSVMHFVLPLLSILLEDTEIRRDDALRLCVYIEVAAPEKPKFRLPNDIAKKTTKGLARLLDKKSGDPSSVSGRATEVDPEEDLSDIKVTRQSRKRILYAHSEILEEKSEYFKDLLTSGFAETERYNTIIVDDASFSTLYWILQLDKAHVDRILHPQTSTQNGSAEWNYLRLPLVGDWDAEVDSTSPENEPINLKDAPSSKISAALKAEVASISETYGEKGTSQQQKKMKKDTMSTSPSKIPTMTVPQNYAFATPNSSKSHFIASHLSALSRPNSSFGIGTSARIGSGNDPHPHPTPRPPPASALDVYMLAHRYRLEELREMAMEQILRNLSHETCMSAAFVSYPYEELHSKVLAYIAKNWTQVKASSAFLRCIKEVREDVWGEYGPMVLHNIYLKI
ncbi:hypothetical protein I315_05874 [Cryptococcus gattii Ru294]|uniref:BTB domain-containing protein n=1 Tax=Cryptococcus gattii serotype B (strain WM276 / ATCC MYA-4071) TaxID=367775 RepID=E6R7B5_CRYGW|nr:Hypothetical Protein CGB_E4720C [Cryptococcus gattii WM276]ADV22573.1 Hypothetical Protein CGB_E4720C [Cryptococcus gattii WM276]KIR51650.1 hypothetical protein I315_05874 [Cryptococcus gattii Ru294]KJE02855.1 hypothetical protein I311_03356 [Cryptococcus gattii NT-10]